MIRFVCDNCSIVKQPEEVWIAGQAAEQVGSVTARREVTIQSVWNRANIFHPLAVHFCSLQCKDEYLAKLFAPDALVEEVAIERSAPSEVVVETEIREEEEPQLVKKKTVRQKRAA